MKVWGLRLYHYQQLYHSQYSSQSLPDSAVSGGNGGRKKEIKRMLSLLKTSSFSSDFLISLQYSWDEAIYQVLSCLVHSVSQDQIPVLTGLHFSPVGPDSSLTWLHFSPVGPDSSLTGLHFSPVGPDSSLTGLHFSQVVSVLSQVRPLLSLVGPDSSLARPDSSLLVWSTQFNLLTSFCSSTCVGPGSQSIVGAISWIPSLAFVSCR